MFFIIDLFLFIKEREKQKYNIEHVNFDFHCIQEFKLIQT